MTQHPGPWILSQLAAYGVEHVFGIPGVHTIALYDGFDEAGITHVTPRHEQGAGFMADAYARVSGGPGVCFVITGPGTTNIATAMGQAYADSIPMLVISSVSNRRHLGRGLGQLHELQDQQALMAGVSAFSHTLHSLADLPAVLARAFGVFTSERPRPVHIEIPLDLWDEPVAEQACQPRAQPMPRRPIDSTLDAAGQRLEQAERPVILAGGGIHSPSALVALAERLDAPVVMTVNGRGLVPGDHPLGVPASPSLAAVRELITDSDVVLAIGTEMGPTDYDMYERGMPALPGTLIRVDIDPLQMAQPFVADIPLLGDAKITLKALYERLPANPAQRDGAGRAQATRAAAWTALPGPMCSAVKLLDVVRDTLPESIIVGDSTHPIYAGNLYFAAARPNSWFNSSTGYGTLGYALPAALGAALAAPDRPAVCLVGDGGLHYTLGELGSIRDQDRGVIVLLWDNAAYGEIRMAMQDAGVKPVGVELFAPQFDALAQAYGFAFTEPADETSLTQALRDGAQRRKPTLIRVDEARMLAAFD